MNNPKFQIFKSSTKAEYSYRLRSPNGEIILNGEGYINKKSCIDGIVSVKVNAPFDNRYERKDSPNSYSFNLRAINGEIIGRSENYTSQAARENGISAVKKHVRSTAVEDFSLINQ